MKELLPVISLLRQLIPVDQVVVVAGFWAFLLNPGKLWLAMITGFLGSLTICPPAKKATSPAIVKPSGPPAVSEGQIGDDFGFAELSTTVMLTEERRRGTFWIGDDYVIPKLIEQPVMDGA